MGDRGNIPLPAPEGLELGQIITWMWPWEIKVPHMRLVALVAPWGRRVDRTLQIVRWVIGVWPQSLLFKILFIYF